MPIHKIYQTGFSLVETVMFIVIVSVALAGVLSVMNFTTLHSADPLIRKQAIVVAESMLEEIAQHDFANPSGGFSGAATPANRALFDDIGDYHGYASSGIFAIDNPGAPIPELAKYNAAVRVTDTTLGPAGAQIPAGSVKLISVTITGPDNVPVALSGYRSAYGP